jgi:hypothetical protein
MYFNVFECIYWHCNWNLTITFSLYIQSILTFHVYTSPHTPHFTFHVVTGCAEHSGAQVNSTSLILTNLKLRFEPCVFNLIWKWYAKIPKKIEIPSSTFHEHWSEEVHCKKYTMSKFFFDVWTLQCNGSRGMKGYNFLRLMLNKVVQRFYSYFLKFPYFDFSRKWIL